MRANEILLCLVVVCFVSLGQVLLRHAAVSFGQEVSPHALNAKFFFRIVLAFSVYGVAMLLWVYILSRIPLTIAFSFFGLSFFLVPIFAYCFLGDALTWKTWCGALVICIGIGITVS